MASNIDKLIDELGKENSSLQKLIDKNEQLQSNYDETSRERLKRLSDDVNKQNEILLKVIDGINKDLGKRIDINNLPNELLNISKSISRNKTEVKELNEELKELKKLLKDASSQEEMDKINKDIIKCKKNLSKANDILETNQNAYKLLEEAAKSYYSACNDEQEEFNKRQREGITILDDWKEKWDKKTKGVRSNINGLVDGAKGLYKAFEDMIKPYAEAQDASLAYGRSIGMSAKETEKYFARTRNWAANNDIGILFKKTTADLIELENQYSETLGRNIKVSDSQRMALLSIDKYLGSGTTMELVNNLENFGLGMNDTADFVKKTMDEATRYGISASKLTKTVSDNIKMAQNYTFKNGLAGLTSMAKKAVQIKTDMSLIDSFAEKVSTVEGAISTGAQLQVLGGSYAMGSDPLSMMHGALMDYEGLFDRAVGMAQGKVHYNAETGNFEMGAMERYLMKQAATAMGIDPSKLIDVAFRKASLDKIEGVAMANDKISGDTDMIEMIKNIATWKDGNAYVNVNGKDKLVSDLGDKDKLALAAAAKTDSQNLQSMATDLRGIHDMMSQEEMANEQAKIMGEMGDSITSLLKNNQDLLNKVAQFGAWFNIITAPLGSLTQIAWNTTRILWKMGGGIVGRVSNLLGRGGFFGMGTGGAAARGATTAAGGASAGRGGGGMLLGNLFGRRAKGVRGFKPGTLVVGKNGTQYTAMANGTFKNMATGKVVSGGAANNLAKGATVAKSGSSFLKTGIGSLGGSVGGGLLAGGISLGVDMLTGEYKKDKKTSLSKAAGATAGTVLGTFIGGPIGGMIGGWLGSVTVDAVVDSQKKYRKKVRDNISKKYGENSLIGQLFSGPDALQTNFDEYQLAHLEKALQDGVLSVGEMVGDLEELRANGDLIRMAKHGIIVEQFAQGTGPNKTISDSFTVRGNTHSAGGVKFAVKGTDGLAELEGNEQVYSQSDARKINSMISDVKQIKDFGETKIYQSSNQHQTDMNMHMSPLSVNVNGNFTVSNPGGTSSTVGAKELFDNPSFKSLLRESIFKEVDSVRRMGYNKTESPQKF